MPSPLTNEFAALSAADFRAGLVYFANVRVGSIGGGRGMSATGPFIRNKQTLVEADHTFLQCPEAVIERP